MGKNTPLWVANYGTSVGFKQTEDKLYQGVVDVEEKENQVIIKTEAMEY